jgi:hypothetical protein
VSLSLPTSQLPTPRRPRRACGPAALLEEITEDTKAGGLIHHTSLPAMANSSSLTEWKTAEQFQSFFGGNAKVAKVMESVGVTGPPAIAIYNEVEAAGKV